MSPRDRREHLRPAAGAAVVGAATAFALVDGVRPHLAREWADILACALGPVPAVAVFVLLSRIPQRRSAARG